MDLPEIFKALWKHKWLMLFSILVGLVLMQISLSRSHTTYETSIGLILDEPSFGYGNLDSGLARAVSLSRTYPALIMSEIIQRRVREKLLNIEGVLQASVADNAPFIAIKVTGTRSRHIMKVANTTADVFISYIYSEQKKNKIPRADRVLIYKTGAASKPSPIKSRTFEIALIVFLSTVGFGVLLSLIIENFKQNLSPTKKSHTLEPPKSMTINKKARHNQNAS